MKVADLQSVNSFPERLKAATNLLHRELESLEVSANLAAGILPEEQYLKYLEAMHDFAGSVEQKAFPLLEGRLDDLESRRKLHWLGKDLGRDPKSFNAIFDDSPWDEAFAFGVAYVLEGSTLGGRYIRAKLLEQGRIPEQKMNFFDGYGNKTGIMWKHFLNSISAFATTAERECGIMRGANFAFRSIREHLRLQIA